MTNVLTNGQMDELLDEQTPFRIFGQTDKERDVWTREVIGRQM